MVSNITAQPGFDVAEPSTVAGFADAAAKAVAPLKNCFAVQVIAVQSDVQVGSDQKATSIVQQQISALMRTMTLSLTESKVGRAPFGTPLSEVRPVLVAVLGKPDRTSTSGCEASGQKWTSMLWGGLRVSFDATKSDKPLDSWELQAGKDQPSNLAPGKWPFRATVSQLQKIDPDLRQVDMFDTGGGPWMVSATKTLWYLWDEKKTGQNSAVVGGKLYACE